jgi:protein-L-isoaspartate O-methyltransferase
MALMLGSKRKSKMDFAKRRAEMVNRHIAHRGVRSTLVLGAMGAVPRETFLPQVLWEFAYDDAPLPIAEGQTISQPYIVAMMTEALELKEGCLHGRAHRSACREICRYARQARL